MENTITTKVQKDQHVQLISGIFNPTESRDLVSSLFGEKINYHKLKRLSDSIHDESMTMDFHSEKIDALNEEKDRFNRIVKKAREEGKKIRLSAQLDVELI